MLTAVTNSSVCTAISGLRPVRREHSSAWGRPCIRSVWSATQVVLAQPTAVSESKHRGLRKLRKQRAAFAAATAIATGAADSPAAGLQSSDRHKVIWVQTLNKGVFTAAIEAGLQDFVFERDAAHLPDEWSRIASIPVTLHIESDSSGQQRVVQQCGSATELAAVIGAVSSRDDVEQMAKLATRTDVPAVIMDAADWQSIPAENLVAAFQGSGVRLMATAESAADGRMKLEALESGVGGVLLRTEDPMQVRELAAYVRRLAAEGASRLEYDVAMVTGVRATGMGDRVCVDLCSNMVPGEGLLVGSFARGLFLVHSECAESAYINSRPFRVNAGPVHAYTQGEGGKTAYLSELASGANVQIADAAGRQCSAVVGRVKVETRPFVLVEAQTQDGASFSTLLQNAETVRLVGPAATGSISDSQDWQATSVSQLAPGDEVFVLRQGAARHTGIAIEERIVER